LVEKGLWGGILGGIEMGMVTVIYEKSAFINFSAFFFKLFLVRVREKFIFV